MRQVYSWGVSQLSIPDVTIVPLPLYEVLDGKDTTDYVARVEPSEKGSFKLFTVELNAQARYYVEHEVLSSPRDRLSVTFRYGLSPLTVLPPLAGEALRRGDRGGASITSTYAQMTFCPPCSNELERCMICGGSAPVASNYIPPKTLGTQQQAGMVYAKPIEPEDPSMRHAPSPHRSRPCGCGAAATLPSPPPPPTMGPASRLAADFDLDWAFGGSSPTWNQAPPSPPPPPSNRGKQVPLAGAPRAGAAPPPMNSGQGANFHDQAARMGSSPPPGDLVRSHKQRPQAHFNLDPAVDRGADKDGTWQGMYTIATDRLDQMLDYLGTFQIPGMGMNQWSTCGREATVRRSDSRDMRGCNALEGSFLQPPWHLHAIITGGDFLVHAQH
eukprot:s474_g13.t1